MNPEDDGLATSPAPPADWRDRPRFTGPTTFMRTKYQPDANGVDIALVGVPLDLGQTNRPGTRHGPAQIREQSTLIRRMNPVTGVAPFDIASVADIGDVVLDALNLARCIEQITEYFGDLAERGIGAVAAGGDHTITLPIVRGLKRDRPIALIQFDSHTDMWDEFYGVREMNATGFRRLIEEERVDPARMFQIGIRGTRGGPEDVELSRERGVTVIEMTDVDERGVASILREVREKIGDDPVYVTFDVDGLDPSQAPGTGVPEPGGFTMREAQALLRGLHGMNVIGADVCEVSPPLDPTGITSLNGANLMFELTCLMAHARQLG